MTAHLDPTGRRVYLSSDGSIRPSASEGKRKGPVTTKHRQAERLTRVLPQRDCSAYEDRGYEPDDDHDIHDAYVKLKERQEDYFLPVATKEPISWRNSRTWPVEYPSLVSHKDIGFAGLISNPNPDQRERNRIEGKPSTCVVRRLMIPVRLGGVQVRKMNHRGAVTGSSSGDEADTFWGKPRFRDVGDRERDASPPRGRPLGSGGRIVPVMCEEGGIGRPRMQARPDGRGGTLPR